MTRVMDKAAKVQRPVSDWLPHFYPTIAGTAITASITGSGSANAESDWQDAIASCAINADGFYFSVRNGAVADFLFDIGLGGSGTSVDSTIVTNLLVSTGTAGEGSPSECYIPLGINAGTRIAVRCQSSDASQTPSVAIRPVAGGHYRTIRCSRATTYGADTSDSGGLQVDPGGSASTKGLYSVLSASTTNPIKQAIICVGSKNNGTIGVTHDHRADISTGADGAETVVVGDLRHLAGATGDIYIPVWRNVFLDIPAGTRLVVRSSDTQTDATDRLWDCVLVCFD